MRRMFQSSESVSFSVFVCPRKLSARKEEGQSLVFFYKIGGQRGASHG